MYETDLRAAFLRKVDLSRAQLENANLSRAKLHLSDLSYANLRGTNLSRADLRQSNLKGSNLREARLVETDLSGADLTGCRVYGISVWNSILTDTIQRNLIVTRPGESRIEVDRLEIAQFIYLLLNNTEIRHVIGTITSKVVLILGRFTESRKAVLDALKDALRFRNYLPILFDFEKPSSRSVTETVSTLAHMAKFIIADITDAKSIPQELMAIVPNLRSVPVQPLLLAS
jgi:uncharacterized protein YjbI with pentapeptide repeats